MLCAGHHQLRCSEASSVVPYRAATAAAGHGELSTSADGRSAYDTGQRLHDPAHGGAGMSEVDNPQNHPESIDTP
jgi:hypothetical protein